MTSADELNPTGPAPSKVEIIKGESNGLRGTILESLASDETHFDEANVQLIKFHGAYEQDNRDLRAERRRLKLDKAWSYMIRARIPGGRVTRDQYLALDELGTRYTHDGSLRLTSRQGIQFHGVGRKNLKGVIRAINDVRLTTLAACGDVNRNVMGCAIADIDWRAGLGIGKLCNDFANHFAPRTSAYWEIWCDGEKWGEPVTPTTEEPIYGKYYMPRKFKMAFAVPEDNDVDLYSQDIGWEIVHENGRIVAFDVIVGGGLGHSHNKQETYPRLGDRAVRILPEELYEVAEAIFGIQRDFGDRSNRQHARFKYLISERGVEWFREELARRLGRQLPPAGPKPKYKIDDHLGWHEMADGRLFVGIHIVNGRVIDREGCSMKTGLRNIIENYVENVYVTPKQNIVLAGIDPARRNEVEDLMFQHGLHTHEGISTIKRLAMACVAMPTCGLALAESERYIPSLITELEHAGVGDAPVEIRMTGCPNSCVRTPMAEIGIVGRAPGKYNIYLGGRQDGTRLAFLFKETVAQEDLSSIIVRLIEAWRQETGQGLSFGDWAVACGPEALSQLVS